MPVEPAQKRAITFVDGQNLFFAVKDVFGYAYPNYDVMALSKAVCRLQNWHLRQARFYTGVPDQTDNAFWHHFWNHKLAIMGRHGVHVFSRSLRYRNRRVRLPDSTQHTFTSGEEKGIDVRIAIDVIRLAHSREYDVAVIFSQDQDLSEVADEVRVIAKEQNRWIKVASAFPVSPVVTRARGINKTDWIRIDRTTYDTCIDSRDYRSIGT
ncbi:MAG: NYN domain-containing protein [Candidatus Aureabacteria bacterium]|nr:NYN domain-containing protein [Candidatus Auribacterota bacterium]NLW94012.1 NYN domain-containing protein [Chlamydiota bacterium]HOE27425.1 NYN domain-containing protein [bacterium]HQM52749.1 NYN domain-containing protein [bacterium]